MILDGYAAYLLAKQKAEETNKIWNVWISGDDFVIIPVDGIFLPTYHSTHIITIIPTAKLMSREEYMKCL